MLFVCPVRDGAGQSSSSPVVISVVGSSDFLALLSLARLHSQGQFSPVAAGSKSSFWSAKEPGLWDEGSLYQGHLLRQSYPVLGETPTPASEHSLRERQAPREVLRMPASFLPFFLAPGRFPDWHSGSVLVLCSHPWPVY